LRKTTQLRLSKSIQNSIKSITLKKTYNETGNTEEKFNFMLKNFFKT